MDITEVDTVRSNSRSRWYPSYRSPLAAPRLIRLPLGSVGAGGWLAFALRAMCDGLTGRLSEVSPFLAEENPWLEPAAAATAGWEEAPYWIRGAYDLGVLADDRRVISEAMRYIDAAIDSQQADGYFGPAFLKDMRGDDGTVTTDLWPHMLMLAPIIHHYEHTGDQRVVPFVRRFFAYCRDMPDDRFIPRSATGFLGWGGEAFGSMRPFLQYVRAGDMIPHVHWLFDQTGEGWLLELAERFYHRIRPAWDEWLDHHAVNFPERFAYDGIFSPQSGKPSDLARTEYWYHQHLSTWGQMPGGIFAADERIRPGCTDPRFGFETCGMVEFARSNYFLGMVSGDPRYAERTEEIMFNHFPVTHTPDFRGVHYITAANQPVLSGTGRQLHRNNRTGDTSYVGYTPMNRCCGHNAGFGWPWFVEHLWMATPDEGLACWMYGASTVRARVGDEGRWVTIHEETDYPFSGTVTFRIEAEGPVAFNLYLRIPEWAQAIEIIGPGGETHRSDRDAGYLLIRDTFSPGDTIRMRMEMTTQVTRWPANGAVSVRRGPLWYSLGIDEEWSEHPDLGNDRYVPPEGWRNQEVHPTSPWNYGLILTEGEDASRLPLNEIGRTPSPLPENPWTRTTAPLRLSVRAKLIAEWGLTNDCFVGALQTGPVASDSEIETVELIPAGCARLRIMVFPEVATDGRGHVWEPGPAEVDPQTMPPNRFDALYPMSRSDQ